MTFGTVCDGIGCGHLAFNRAGFECVWSAEIEPFPCAVLAYRFPDVRNHGDMNLTAGLVERGEIAAPDVFIGGTPCQAFSVAGKRKGLSDARGNLSLTFCGIADAIDDVRGRDGKPPCVILWENVPGVLSDSGNAFGCFLGELAGSGCQLQPPGDGWGNAGCVFGPKRTVAWRVLDSQFFGVAQRRRRVFVVASAGDGCRPEEILFEREGVRRDSPPSREAGQGSAGDAGSGFTTSSFGKYEPGVGTLRANGWDLGGGSETITVMAHGQANAEIAKDICPTLNCNHEVPIATYDMRGNGDGETVGTLTGDHAGRPTDYTPVVAFSCKDYGNGSSENLSPTLRAMEGARPNGGGQMAIAFAQNQLGEVRSGEIANTLNTNSNASGRNTPMIALGEGVTHSLTGEGFDASEDGSGRGTPLVPTPAMQVRRLTPCECEALQGLPRNWTLIPIKKVKRDRLLSPKKNADDEDRYVEIDGEVWQMSADGPRYKGIGNGQTVTVMEWLAGRVMNALERTEP